MELDQNTQHTDVDSGDVAPIGAAFAGASPHNYAEAPVRPRLRRPLFVACFVVAATLMMGGAALYVALRSNAQRIAASNVGVADTFAPATIDIPSNLIGELQGDSNAQLVVNGQLKVEGGLVLAPSAVPAKPVTGQLYFDQDERKPYYYDGNGFVSLLDTTRKVTSLGGASGDISLGNGLVLQGGVLSAASAGLTSIRGAPDQISVTSIQGDVTLSLPQNIGQGSVPTFAGLSLAGMLSTGGGIALTGSGHTLLLQSPSLATDITFILPATTGGAGQCLSSDGTGALSFVDCLTASGPTSGVMSLNGTAGNLTIADSSTAGSTITIHDASTTQKGIASFDTTNFTVTNGAVDTVQDIATTSTPTFAGLNLLSALGIGQGGTGATTASGARSSLGAAGSGVNSDITSTMVLNTITPTNTLTLGSSTQSFVLQGNTSSTITATAGGNTTTLSFANPIANTILTLPALAAGTYSICTTVGNCAGLAGDVTTAGGTAGRLVRFSGPSTLVDSLVSEAGSTLTVAGSGIIQGASGTAALTLGTGAANNGQLVFANSTNSNTLTLQSGATTSNLAFTLPVADGGSGQCLGTNGSGVLAFQNCLTGSSVGSGVSSLNGVYGAVSIANSTAIGSTITLNDATTLAKGIASYNATNFSVTSGAVNTVQDIATTSAPTFAGLGVTGAGGITVGTSSAAGKLSLRDGNSASFAADLQTSALTATRTITLRDASGTVCLEGNANCGFAPANGSGNYIQLAPAVAQTDATSNSTLFVNKTGASGNLVQLQKNGSTVFGVANDGSVLLQNATNSAAAFDIQNATSTSLLTVSTAASVTNLIANSSFESGVAGWTPLAGASVTQTSSQKLFGSNSMQVATTATTNDGVSFAAALASSATYSLSFSAKATASVSALQVGYSANGSTFTTCTLLPSLAVGNNAILSTGWRRYACTFATGTVSGSPFVYIRQTDALTKTLYIDGIQLEQTSAATAYNAGGQVAINGVINKPLMLQPTESTGEAFSVRAPDGQLALSVDTSSGLNQIRIRGTSAQTFQPAFSIEDSTGGQGFQISAQGTLVTSGAVGIGTLSSPISSYGSNFSTVAWNSAGQAAAFAGLSGQTGDLVRYYDSNKVILSGVTAGGGLYTNGANNTFSGLSTPTQTTTSTGTSYYYVITAVNSVGETLASNSIGMANNTSAIAWNNVPGATSYKIYRNTDNNFTSGGSGGANQLRTTITSGLTVTFTDTAAATTAGLPPTTTAGSKLTVKGWANQTNNIFEVTDAFNTSKFSVAASGVTSVNGGRIDNGVFSVTAAGTGTPIFIGRASGGQATDVFQLQSSTGNITSAFDSTGARLTLGRIAASGTVVQGKLTLSDGTTSNFGTTLQSATLTTGSQTITIPDTAGVGGTICLQGSASCGFATGTSGSYIQNGTALQTANFNIQSGAPGSTGGIVRAAAGQTANIFEVQNASGTATVFVDAAGGLRQANVFAAGGSGTSFLTSVSATNYNNNGATALSVVSNGSGDSLHIDAANNTATFLKVDNGGNLTSNGTNNTFGNLAVPAFTTASTGTSFYYVITASNANGETIASASLGMANSTSALAWTQVPGATSYKIYRNTTNSFAAGSLLRTTISNGSTISFTDTAAATTTGLPPTTANPGTQLVVKSWQGQAGNLLDVQNSAGVSNFKVTAVGDFVAGASNNLVGGLKVGGAYAGHSNKLQIETGVSTLVGQAILGASGQTADLLQMQDASSNVNAAFNGTGNQLTLGRIAASGTVTQGKLVLADGTTSNFGTTLQSATLTTGSQTILIPNTAGAGGTICLQSSAACGFALGSGAAVQLAPSVAQSDNSTNSSIMIDKTGASGNLLTLMAGGATKYSVDFSGNTSQTGNLTCQASCRAFIGGAPEMGAYLNVGGASATRQRIATRAVGGQTASNLEIQGASGEILSGVSAAGALFTNGTNNIFTSITPPVITSPSTVGTSYYYAVTATNAAGETAVSNVLAMNANTSILNWTQVPGATGYKIYRNTTNAFGVGSLLLTTITNGTVVTYTDTASATTAGLPPAAATTGALLTVGPASNLNYGTNFTLSVGALAGQQSGFNGFGSLYVRRATGSAADASLVIGAPNSATVTAIIQGVSSQTGDLLQFRDSSNAIHGAFNGTGSQLSLGRVASSGTVTQGKLVLADGTTSNFGSTLQSATLTAAQTITLPNATGTVCLQSSTSCGFLQLAPTVAQADASTNTALIVNKTGASGYLLQLQKNGIDQASIDYNGFLYASNGATISTFNVGANKRVGISTPASASIMLQVGINGGGDAFNSSSAVRGVSVQPTNTGTGDITGVYSNPITGASSANMYGVYAVNRQGGTSTTTTNSYHLYAASPIIGAGTTITNQYGLYLESQKITGVTTGYGVYQAGSTDMNYFAGSLGVGTATPQASSLQLGNGWWIAATDSAGTGVINMFQPTTSNDIQVGAGLNVDGGIVFPTDGGQLTMSDMVFSSSGVTAGTAGSYTMRIGSSNALTVYGENDGAGNAQNVRVAVGSSITPAYTLDVAGDINTSTKLRVGGVVRIDTNGNITTAHIITSGATPGIASGSAACTTPTVGVVGNDTAGTITVTTGTGCAATGTVATVTFASAFGSAPRVVLTPGNATAANARVYRTSATGNFTLATATALTDSTTYVFDYIVQQ